jgi:hypothetical protein
VPALAFAPSERNPALPIVRFLTHNGPMPQDRNYRVSLQEFEHESRVPPEDRIELVEPSVVPLPDPRGPRPDRDWFNSGG